jgi:excisionase family DNA binding protein
MDPEKKDQPTAITEVEVARRLAVSVSTVQAWRRRRQGPAYLKIGRAVRYRPEDVDAYLEACRRATD